MKNYVIGQTVKPLFKENSTIIALLVDNLCNQSNITLLHCIEEIAYKEGYQIIICNIENKDRYIHMLKQNNIAGVILTRAVLKV